MSRCTNYYLRFQGGSPEDVAESVRRTTNTKEAHVDNDEEILSREKRRLQDVRDAIESCKRQRVVLSDHLDEEYAKGRKKLKKLDAIIAAYEAADEVDHEAIEALKEAKEMWAHCA